jgi:hypothetical protein
MDVAVDEMVHAGFHGARPNARKFRENNVVKSS